MNYDVIVKKMIDFDKRNKFKRTNNPNINLPSFYHSYDPYDVEIDYDCMIIRFCQISKLESLNKEYGYLNVDLVFATNNGDPIFVGKGKIYTCEHGSNNPEFEKIANNFDEFLKKITD